MEQNDKGYVLINLMPYREKIKSRKIKTVSVLFAGFAIFAGIVLFSLYSFISLEMDSQIQRNNFISAENKKLDEDIKSIAALKEDIKQTLAKRKVVEDLQVDRSDVVTILNIISNQLPDGSSLKSIKQVDNKITIVGTTQSNNKVSNYMTNLDNSGYFSGADLIEIKAISNPSKKPNAKVSDDQTLNEFTINATVKAKEVPADKKGNKKVTKGAQ